VICLSELRAGGINRQWFRKIHIAVTSEWDYPAPVGQVTIGEWSVKAENLREIRNFVGLVFQNPDNQLFMPTVWEDIAFANESGL